MYTVFFSPTANGYKILLMLEALAVSYDICHFHLAGDEQFLPGPARRLQRWCKCQRRIDPRADASLTHLPIRFNAI
jgi:hypothetical protein